MAVKKKKKSNFGSRIMKVAKRIRNAHPSKKWTSCVKEAGKKLKAK